MEGLDKLKKTLAWVEREREREREREINKGRHD